MPSPNAIRDHTKTLLDRLGFRFASGLPLPEPDRYPRPRREIAARLIALQSLCGYVSAPEKHYPEQRIREMVETHALEDHLSPEERAMLALPRDKANAEHAGTIGWRMENMLPLAWALGHDLVPAISGDMIDGDDLRALFKFCPQNAAAGAAFLASGSLRPADEILLLEDAFYAAHNAARCAYFGRDPSCVPEGFHPVAGMGVIQERRMSLTWMLSPGVAWDDTDLST